MLFIKINFYMSLLEVLFMRQKYLCSVIEEFEDETFFDENDYINDFLSFCLMKFRFLNLSSINEDCINKFLFMWLPGKIIDSTNGNIEGYVNSINLFLNYIREKYNINIKEKNNNDIIKIKRICDVNKSFKRFLCNPVISHSPLIIDLDIYKKRKIKENKIVPPCLFDITEKGYFTVKEIFAEDRLLLQKIYTGRFFKVTVDKNITQNVRKDDILYANLKQSPFFVWNFTELYKYYPNNVIEYIRKEVHK